MAGGTRDRIVNTSGGGGGGGDVVITGLTSPNPLPVTDATAQGLIQGLINALGGVLDVSGSTITIQEPLDVNIVGGAGTGLTDAELRASPVPVVTQEPISVDDNGGSLTVDGPLTDTELRASPVDVDITNASVTVDDGGTSLTVDGPLTDAELRATPVPVSGTVTITDGSGPVTVDGTVGVTGDVTVVGKAADGAAVSGNPVLIAGQDGTNAQSLRTDTTGNAGTYPKSASATLADGASAAEFLPLNEAGNAAIFTPALNMHFNGTTWDRLRGNTSGQFVQGNIAHDGIDSGNPQKIGGKARSSAPADVAANDRVDAYFDLKGRLKVDGSDVTQPVSGTVTANVAATTGTLANGAETAVSSTAVQVLASNVNRKAAIIQNTGSQNVRVGISGVTATTGVQLRPGGSITLSVPYVHTGAVFAIRESADSTVLAQEVA